jgi:hypothetical protein
LSLESDRYFRSHIGNSSREITLYPPPTESNRRKLFSLLWGLTQESKRSESSGRSPGAAAFLRQTVPHIDAFCARPSLWVEGHASPREMCVWARVYYAPRVPGTAVLAGQSLRGTAKVIRIDGTWVQRSVPRLSLSALIYFFTPHNVKVGDAIRGLGSPDLT